MSLVVNNVRRMLDEKGLEYEIIDHEPVYTSEQASKVRGVLLENGVKAMVLKTEECRYIIVLIRADKRIDMKLIARMEETKKLHLAKPDEVFKLTGCKIGSVPPFGHMKELKTYLDRDILEEEEVNFNIGEHTKSIKMKGSDLIKILDKAILY